MPSEPVALDKTHRVDHFDCGKEPLNEFLKRFAMPNQTGGAARTYVTLVEQGVVGYYSLAPASVEPADVPERIIEGQARHPVPCVLLARLAVDKEFQGGGLGKYLFRDALLRAYRAHEEIGGRAFLVHAIDDDAAAFYSRYGMLPSPTHPMHLYLLFKDIRAMLQRG